MELTMDTSLTSKRVIRELNQLIAWRGQPTKIWVDNESEFEVDVLAQWASQRNI